MVYVKDSKAELKWIGLGILSLFAIIMIGILAGKIIDSDFSKETPVPLTAEQQQIVSELQTATRGDIIVDPSGATMETHRVLYLLVRESGVTKNGEYHFALSPMDNFGFISMTGSWSQNKLARANAKLIKLDSDEWVQIIRRYFGTKPSR